MQMPHTVPRLRARAQRALPRALLRAPPQRLRSRPAPQTVRRSHVPPSFLRAQGLPTDCTPAKLARRICDCRFASGKQLCSLAAWQPEELPHCFLSLISADTHVVMHAMTYEACCPGSSGQDDPEQRTPGAEAALEESAAPKRRRDIKDQRGDSLTKPYIPFSAGPRDCLGQRLGMTYVSTYRKRACQRHAIASLASTTMLKFRADEHLPFAGCIFCCRSADRA